ncbi:hypothetical protein BGZ65_000740 [Modicella reniformis]|uniref:Uncharacterized protein n=1 Tax=Modicella reniformis TaxID=1440133 RepID=A0A9P6INV1_9FUNG|nr:hypothetical protein BGZ65_000740 [Modicella reniformis]
MIPSFCLEESLDVGALDIIMAFFRRCYRKGGRNLFLAPSDLQSDYDISHAKEAEMLYAFVRAGNHWGVVCLDLVKISFGDSLGRRVPINEINDMIQEMQLPESNWEQAKTCITRFDVPKQQGPGSCCILAVIAIEQAVNPFADWGTHISADYHRIRFLRLLTKQAKSEEDRFALAHWKHYPEDKLCHTEAEHMDEYLTWAIEISKEASLGCEGGTSLSDGSANEEEGDEQGGEEGGRSTRHQK